MNSRDPSRREQRRAIRDLERRMAELDRLDRELGLGAMPGAPRKRRSHSGKGNTVVALLASALVMAAVVAFLPGEAAGAVRRLVGLGDDRLGAAPIVPDGDGSYAFSQTQRGSDEPVGYSPCRPIRVVVNPEGAPGNYDELVDTAIEHTSEATGLRFERVGLTDDRTFEHRYSENGEEVPVIVAWATEDEVEQLEGNVAGIGGSAAVSSGTGPTRYVTGIVVLDRATFDTFGPLDHGAAQGIVDHEFGHLVGLGHVDDPGEIMNEQGVRVSTYGPGDLEGLARIGSIGC